MTVAADKGYDTRDFVRTVRAMRIRPHAAQNTKRPGGSAIGARTTRHPGYARSQSKRPLIEKAFGWMKQNGNRRKTKLRGLVNVGWQFVMTAAAFNLWRLPKLKPATTWRSVSKCRKAAFFNTRSSRNTHSPHFSLLALLGFSPGEP